ncbi:MAG: alpha/beta fold hydrolase [Pseudomonadota bacterium]
MRKFAFYLLGSVGLSIAGLFALGPYESSDLAASFDEARLESGVDDYVAKREARFSDITSGVEKRVIWVDKREQKAAWSVLYIHGFSATSEEIRPVPDEVAKALSANLIYTRLTGHGRSGVALADARISDWTADVAEALAIARKIGDRVLILSTSTGATLATAAALDGDQMMQVAGLVMISPNFGINNSMAALLTWPAARYWLPVIAGQERSFEPRSERQELYWTTRYPSAAIFPMAALVQEVVSRDLSQATVPALFIYSKEDRVVLPDATADVVARWGGPTKALHPTLGPLDDPFNHVIAGDIMSPGQTDSMIRDILAWAEDL